MQRVIEAKMRQEEGRVKKIRRNMITGILLSITTVALFGQTEKNYVAEDYESKDAIKPPSGNIALVDKRFEIQADSIPPDHTGMRNLTSVELAREMVPGWNVGNSLEAIGGETAWGNPKITQRLIDS